MATPPNTTPGATRRSRALSRLAQSMPVADARVASGLQQARDIQLQSTLGSLPPPSSGATPGVQVAQAAGAQQTAAAGQAATQLASQSAQRLGQVGQMIQSGRGQQLGAALAGQQMGNRMQGLAHDRALNQLDQQTRDQLLGERLQFMRDEGARGAMNERALADFAVLRAVDQEKMRDYAQEAKQQHARRLQVLEHAHRMVLQQMQQDYAAAKQAGDQDTMRRISAAQAEAQKAMEKARADASNKLGIWKTAGMVAGGVAGGILTGGNPAGVMAGASVGAGVGTTVGAATQ